MWSIRGSPDEPRPTPCRGGWRAWPPGSCSRPVVAPSYGAGHVGVLRGTGLRGTGTTARVPVEHLTDSRVGRINLDGAVGRDDHLRGTPCERVPEIRREPSCGLRGQGHHLNVGDDHRVPWVVERVTLSPGRQKTLGYDRVGKGVRPHRQIDLRPKKAASISNGVATGSRRPGQTQRLVANWPDEFRRYPL